MIETIQNENTEKAQSESNLSITSNDIKFDLSRKFLVELRKNMYHGTHNEEVVDHIAKVLKMVDFIYVLGVDSHQLHMKVFPLLLADDAKVWWISEGNRKITTWEELVETFLSMTMTIQSGVRGMILAALSEAFKQENVLAERLHGLDQQMERKEDESLYFMESNLSFIENDIATYVSKCQICLRGEGCNVKDFWLAAHSLRYLSENEIESPWILSLNFQDNSKEWNSGDDQLRLRWMIYLVVLADAAESVRDAIGFEYYLASSSEWTK
ncbi:hypothetical protein Tco_1553519 [Tanacetum coccineum]